MQLNINEIYMKKNILIYLFSLIIISCSARNDLPVDEIQLNGTIINIDSSNVILRPWIIIGDKVISRRVFGTHDYYVGLLKNNKWEKSETLYNRGKGHNEVDYLRFAKAKENSLLLLDGGFFYETSCSVFSDIKKIDDLKDPSNRKKYDLKYMESVLVPGTGFCSVSDSTLLICATPEKYTGHIFSIIDYKNQKCHPLDFWPNDGIEIDSLVKARVYASGSYVFGNGKGRYLFRCGNERYSFIFSIEGNKVNVIKDLYTTYSRYRSDGGIPIKERVRPEGLNCDVNSNYIYMLLKDSNREGNKLSLEDFEGKKPSLFGNVIEQYDWDGNMKKRIKLDHSGQRVLLSDDGKTLYLFTDDYYEGDINPQIWSYDINSINR